MSNRSRISWFWFPAGSVDVDETLLLRRRFLLRHLGCHHRISHVLFAHSLRPGIVIISQFQKCFKLLYTAIDKPLDVGRQVLIMTTYYAAQLGIALSVVDSKASYIREEESRKKKKQQRHLLLNEPQEGGSIMAGSAGTDIRHRRIGSVEN